MKQKTNRNIENWTENQETVRNFPVPSQNRRGKATWAGPFIDRGAGGGYAFLR